MYVPKHFAHEERSDLVKLVREFNFGTLVSDVNGAPYATHLPFLISTDENENVVLRGHVAKSNPHWQTLEQGTAMAVFQGPHAYISPTWYNTPGVPTWNYAAVHLSGVPQLVSDQEQLTSIVIALSEQHEAVNPSPWIPDFPADMLSAIVGFTMKIDSIEGKYKLSQNRPAADKIKVIQELRAPFGRTADENQIRIAAMMDAADHNTL